MMQPPSDLMALSAAIECLAGARPVLIRKQLVAWSEQSRPVSYSSKGGFKILPRRAIELDGVSIAPEEISEIAFNDRSSSGKVFISPMGATVLIKFYLAGHIPSKPGFPKEVSDDLTMYAASGCTGKEVMDRAAELRVEARAERLSRLNRDLSEIAESELTLTFLHELFLHKGVKNGSLMLGSITVTKQLSSTSSNSGKSRDWNERFSWVSSEGQEVVVGSDSKFNSNRANDSGRNWGLGRE